VIEIALQSNDEVKLTLLEYDATVYSLDALSAVVAPQTASLPNPYQVQSPGVVSVVESQYVTANPAGVKTKATLTWGQAPDIYVQSGGTYLIEYLAPGASIWKPVASVAGGTTTADIFDLGAGTSGFGVTAINSLGVASARVSVTQEIYGLNTAPSDVANFAVQAYGAAAKFTWTKQGTTLATDLAANLQGRIYVRWAPATSGAVWADGVLVNPDGFPGDTSIGFGPLQTGTYMAKAWNGKTYSANAASFVVTEALVTGGLSTLSTKTESSAFSGTKTYVDVVSGALQMISDTPIDSIVALVDTWGLIDSYPGIATAGEYDFAGTKMDLGSVRASRLYAGITSSGLHCRRPDRQLHQQRRRLGPDRRHRGRGRRSQAAGARHQRRPEWRADVGQLARPGPHRRLPGARLRLPPALHERPDHAQPCGERSQRHRQRLGESRCLH
jgi:hypothetical protein